MENKYILKLIFIIFLIPYFAVQGKDNVTEPKVKKGQTPKKNSGSFAEAMKEIEEVRKRDVAKEILRINKKISVDRLHEDLRNSVRNASDRLDDEAIEKIRKSRASQKFPFKDSKPELLVQSILKKNHVGFKKHKSFKLSKSYHQADVVIEPDKVIEVFGDYWHFNPKKYDGESEQKQKNLKKIRQKCLMKL